MKIDTDAAAAGAAVAVAAASAAKHLLCRKGKSLIAHIFPESIEYAENTMPCPPSPSFLPMAYSATLFLYMQ